jgi:tetratricopeptide (TPR) repeat protein
MKFIADRSRQFSVLLVASWVLLVAIPIGLSIYSNQSVQGAPLVGVLLWFVFLRVARWISPAARADGLMRRGRAKDALVLADRALAVNGRSAWTGTRRLVWLNRRTNALLALARTSDALQSALQAVGASADPETLANLSLSLLWLNRYDEAARAARLVIELTRERSVLAHTVFASVNLAQGMPAEAEALARAGLADVQALLPLVKPEHHVLALAALARAERAQGERAVARELLRDIREAAGQSQALRAVARIAEAEDLTDLEDDEKTREKAFALLDDAAKRWPAYTNWYLTQPNTLPRLRQDERLTRLVETAQSALASQQGTAPNAQTVATALDIAEKEASAIPAKQASRAAIGLQVLTLAATLILLLAWTWRFFVVSG